MMKKRTRNGRDINTDVDDSNNNRMSRIERLQKKRAIPRRGLIAVGVAAGAVICIILLGAFGGLSGCTAGLSGEPRQSGLLQAAETMEPNVASELPSPTPAPTVDRPDPYRIVWMSDTQGYAEFFPEIFASMTKWTVDNAKDMNIRYMIHTGDFVNHSDVPEEWENAESALAVLNGTIPYLTVAGNHDTGGDGQDYSAYLDFVALEDFKSLPTFGGFYKNGQGRYDLLDIGGYPVILMSMGCNVDDDAIDWMNGMLKTYSDRPAILCAHGYIDVNGDLTSDGTDLYEKVVATNNNVKLVLCGHRHGVGRFTAEFDDNGDGRTDRTVYEILSNYQDEPQAGSGYLNILTFDTQKREIGFTSYSPYLKDFLLFDDDPGLESFSIPMDF
jgi:hypothetical protein